MRTWIAGLLLALPLCAESPFRDLKRPAAKRPYAGLVIEWVSQDPKVRAEKVGDLSAPPEEQVVTYTAHLRNLGASNTEPLLVRWFVDGVVAKTAQIQGVGAGQRATTGFTWEAEDGRHWVQVELVGHGEWLTFATDALTVKLAVEKKTWATYEAEFGSFARRMQDSFAGLHASWSSVREMHFAPDGLHERLRVDDVVTYERGEGDKAVPAEFWDHPDYHLYIACDQGGPNGGFYIPGYSIGHNYKGHAGHESLFSDWGENCLWHEIAHFRGVQDFYIFPTEPSDVEKRDAAGNPLPALKLRDEYAGCTMNNPYKETHWSDYAIAVLAAKRGVTRVGRCEDRDNTFGHMWRHIPPEISVQVIGLDGKPVPYVEVEVYRPERSDPGDRFRVRADEKPLFEGTVDREGKLALGDDPFGRRKAEAKRSLWLLVLLKREGVVRARYLTLLDVNMAFWRGQKTEATFQLVWD